MMNILGDRVSIAKIIRKAVVVALAAAIAIPSTASATTTAGKPYISDNEYCRIVTTVETRWTPQLYLSGQPTYGTYLKTGDSLNYVDSGGVPATISIGIGYKVANVSLSFPLGKVSGSNVGISKVAASAGYYKLAAKKYVAVKIITRQECTIGSYLGGSPNWTTAWQRIETEILKVYPVLVKQ